MAVFKNLAAVSRAGMLILVAAVVRPEEAKKTLSVCDVLADLTALNGKEVTIRGRWVTTDHGRLLDALDVCPMKLTTEGFVWPNAIHLVEDKADKLDFASLAEMELKLQRTRGGQEERVIVISFTGILQTRVPPVVAHYPNGQVTGYGFGHLDALPAELLYRAVRDVEVQKRISPSENKRPK